MSEVSHLYKVTNKYNVGRKHMNDGIKNYFVTEQNIKDRELFNLVPGRLKRT